MFPNEGLANILDFILDSPGMALTYRLFKNDETPTVDSVLSDFTESDFSGYAAKAAENEAEPTINGDDEAESLGANMTWTATSLTVPAQQTFGIYVTFTGLDASDKLLFAWRFASPTTIAFPGDFITKKVDWYTKNFNP